MSLADNRHHRARLMRSRRHYWSHWQEPLSSLQCSIVARTPHPCSSWCCGNPRHHFGHKTLGELRERQNARLDLARGDEAKDDCLPDDPATP